MFKDVTALPGAPVLPGRGQAGLESGLTAAGVEGRLLKDKVKACPGVRVQRLGRQQQQGEMGST